MFGLFGPTFDPAKDIPDQSGKVIFITGGNSGLGAATVQQLAAHNPSAIYLAARTKSTADSTIEEVKKTCPDAVITFIPLDLSSLESVKKAADTFNASSKRLDTLINNAGIMANPPGTTKEGYELQFGTNHVGHALLTKLLMPTLERTAADPNSDVRIINVSSAGEYVYSPKGGLVLDDVKTPMAEYSTFTRYGQSKLANILFTKELAKRYPTIKSIAIHPGAVNTELKRGLKQSFPWISYPLDFVANLFTNDAQVGAFNQLWAATSEGAKTGTYYLPVGKENGGSTYSRDAFLAEKLWSWTEEELTKQGY